MVPMSQQLLFLRPSSPEGAEFPTLILDFCSHWPCAHAWLFCSAIQIFLVSLRMEDREPSERARCVHGFFIFYS